MHTPTTSTASRRTVRRTVTLLAAGLLAGGLAAPAAAQSSASVLLTDDSRFEPEQVTVDDGGTVAFEWEGGNTHNVTFEDGPSSETTGEGGVNFERTFDENGEFGFTCTIHPTTMDGTVTVVAADDGAAAPAPEPSDDAPAGDDAPASDDADQPQDQTSTDDTDTGAETVPQPNRVEAGTGGQRTDDGPGLTLAVILGMLGLAVPAAVVAARRR